MRQHAVVGLGIFLILLVLGVTPVVVRTLPAATGLRVAVLMVFVLTVLLVAGAILRFGGGGQGEPIGCIAGLLMWAGASAAARMGAALGTEGASGSAALLGAGGWLLLPAVVVLLMGGGRPRPATGAADEAMQSRPTPDDSPHRRAAGEAEPAGTSPSSPEARRGDAKTHATGWHDDASGYAESSFSDETYAMFLSGDPEGPQILSYDAGMAWLAASLAHVVVEQLRRPPAEREPERLLEISRQLDAVRERLADSETAGTAWREWSGFVAGLARYVVRKSPAPPTDWWEP